MMELTERKSVKINIIIFLLGWLISCNVDKSTMPLECMILGINVDMEKKIIEVGQHNGWSDSTSLILITFHHKSMAYLIHGTSKGLFKGNDIYFYQSTVDSLDDKKYNQIPNNISWKNFTPKELPKDFIMPPYDPIQIQLEYNFNRNCVGDVIRGEGFIKKDVINKCKCQK